jgi:hypothetical protein
MEQGTETVLTTKPRTRFFAVCFAVFLAISMGCGIGAAAFADGFEDLDTAVQDSLVLVQEKSSVSTMPAKPAIRVRFDLVCFRSAGDDPFGAVASTPRPDQIPYIHRNGGMPRAINPTGPPLHA